MQEFNSLVCEIYRSALEQTPWEVVLARVQAYLDASASMMLSFEPAGEAGGFAVANGVPRELVDRYLREVATVDLWHQSLLRRHGALRTGLTYRTDDLVPADALKRSRFHADFLAPANIGSGLGTVLGDGSPGGLPLLSLCFYRPLGAEGFGPQAQARLQSLQPHFTQAWAMRQRLWPASRGLAELAIEQVSHAVLVLAADRSVLFANPAAERLLASLQPPLVRHGRLHCADAEVQAGLASTLRAFASSAVMERAARGFRLCGSVGQGVVVRLMPVLAGLTAEQRAVAVGFMSREQEQPRDLLRTMMRLYGLTRTEAELVQALCDGRTVENYAQSRGVQVSTVRTQLTSVFGRTGARRQAELMRLVYSVGR